MVTVVVCANPPSTLKVMVTVAAVLRARLPVKVVFRLPFEPADRANGAVGQVQVSPVLVTLVITTVLEAEPVKKSVKLALTLRPFWWPVELTNIVVGEGFTDPAAAGAAVATMTTG